MMRNPCPFFSSFPLLQLPFLFLLSTVMEIGRKDNSNYFLMAFPQQELPSTCSPIPPSGKATSGVSLSVHPEFAPAACDSRRRIKVQRQHGR